MSSASDVTITVYVKGLARVLSISSVAHLMCCSGAEGGRTTFGSRCLCLRAPRDDGAQVDFMGEYLY